MVAEPIFAISPPISSDLVDYQAVVTLTEF